MHAAVTSSMAAPAMRKRVAPMAHRRLTDRVDPERWKGSTLACLRHLARLADDNNTDIVRDRSLDDIAGWLGLSIQRTKVIMQTLRKSGVVERVKRGGGNATNVYRLHLPKRTSKPVAV